MTGRAILTISLAALWLWTVPGQTQPDAFWCSTHLIREDMRASDILDRCGEPDPKEIVEEPILAWRPGGGRVQTGVTITEYWIYDRGRGRFRARLTIREGVAEQIELLRR